MQDEGALRDLLVRNDGRSYGAYKGIRGAYRIESELAGSELQLFIDRVQGDPFASPSRVRLRLSGRKGSYPQPYLRDRNQRVALADLLSRRFQRALLAEPPPRSGSGKSGLVSIDAGGQEILERSAVRIEEHFVEARIRVGLPARGRRVLGYRAAELLCDELPRLALSALPWDEKDSERDEFLRVARDQAELRKQLKELGLVAFVADGSILPRQSGASDLPLDAETAVPFLAPESLARELRLSDGSPLRGLAIPAGVTLIVGGGFHGKSTLLEAISRCVFPHVPGDGRERCVTDASAVSIQAEDGRRIAACDLSDFIGELPGRRGTRDFSTEDASGSTSQGANICEALEAGARVLLLDEDRCATNFMTRDPSMRELVAPRNEPILPFRSRVKELERTRGISTILVAGSSGDFFGVADRVIEMREYRAHDRSEDARRIASRADDPSGPPPPPISAEWASRIPSRRGLSPGRGKKSLALDARNRGELRYGEASIDLAAVRQLVDPSQTRAVGYALARAHADWVDERRSLPEVLDALDDLAESSGVEAWVGSKVSGEHPGELARPRRMEIAAAWNRLRGAEVKLGDRST